MVLQYYLLRNLINRVSIVCPVLAYHTNKDEKVKSGVMKKYKKVINFKFFKDISKKFLIFKLFSHYSFK